MEENRDVLFLVDRNSFPKNCPELEDIMSLVNGNKFEINTDSPTVYFNEAIKQAENYELVVPVTRNLYVRDRLRQEGVTTIICI